MTLPKLHLNQSFGLTLFTGVSWGTWWFGLYRIDMSKVYIESVINRLRNDPDVRFIRVHKEQDSNHGRRRDVN
jgi:hypothetical protein